MTGGGGNGGNNNASNNAVDQGTAARGVQQTGLALRDAFARLGGGTMATVLACLLLFCLQGAMGMIGGDLAAILETSQVCVGPPWVLYPRMQYYRFLTAPFFHLSVLHILFNMMAFASLAGRLEKRVGTAVFAYLLLVLGVGGNVIMVALASAVSRLFVMDAVENVCVAGLSGVIFALISDSCVRAGPEAQRKLLGCVVVSARAYPWVVLGAIQLVFPSASFFGHLGGVIMGHLLGFGYLDLLTPTGAWLERVSCQCCGTARSEYFVAADDATGGPLLPSTTGDTGAMAAPGVVSPPGAAVGQQDAKFPGNGQVLGTGQQQRSAVDRFWGRVLF